MRFRFLIVLVALASSGVGAATITAEGLVAKNLEARGGAAKLRAITSMHTLGKMRLGGGLEAKTESWAITPSRYRDDFSLQGMTAAEVVAVPDDLSDRLSLADAVSLLRLRGMAAMLGRIKRQVREKAGL